MPRAHPRLVVAALTVLAVMPPPLVHAQSVPAELIQEMRWRMIGPHRAGRTKSAVGIAGQPNVFYIGVVNGGVWKTTDYGRTWVPIFDDQPTGSIGAVVVAPSNPRILYVGSGEGLQRPDLSTGDGIYKSTDAGATWTHLGLRDGQQIPLIIVDPADPDRLFVAVLGHPYGPNAERGIYRSLNGGASFEKVLGTNENTRGVDLAFDPDNSRIVYAVLWESRQAPWENGVFIGPGTGLYKSTDGGTNWRPLTRGLPTPAQGLGRIGITVAPSRGSRLYATVEASQGGGLYRSDDAGESWVRTTDDNRVYGRASDFAEVKVDPRNPDIVYSANVVAWKSTDAGVTWTAIRGAPGGDDYHRIWINPLHPEIMIFASDQGAIITVNGGETFSSWYNQPTAQLYHVNTDNAFPYRVCGGQQESGSVCVSSRGHDGQINFRDWTPVGVEEYGYAVPDPLNPDIVYGGKVSRWDRRTGQVQQVGPVPVRDADYRVLRTAPVVFSQKDPRQMFFASNMVWRTMDGARSWSRISPDLTRRDSVVPPSVGTYANSPAARARHPGVVYTVAPSPVALGTIWAGTDDGLIQVTRNGGRTWRNVTPPQLTPWAKVSIIDASHFDSLTAYAAINTLRLDDLRPHILRTRDGGVTWTEITRGIPDGGPVNVVREDPVRRGLLFAGTERAVYYSIDEGEHWQSLRLNMPATSIRDLVIKDDDVVVGTHGRSFWILDDITPLRQVTAATAGQPVVLFAPQQAWRVRWNMNTDTPIPQEEPQGENPPDGAIINYALRDDARVVTIEISDDAGRVVRRHASTDPIEAPLPGRNTPDYWIRPPRQVGTRAGMHRFVWDLHHAPLAGVATSYPIAAAFRNTTPEPKGPWAHPGRYTVRLIVDGVTLTQRLVLRMDPRVTTPVAGILQQSRLSLQVADGFRADSAALAGVRRLRAGAGGLRERASGEARLALDDFERAAADVESDLGRATAPLRTVYGILQGADVAPTTQAVAATQAALTGLNRALRAYERLMGSQLAALNVRLATAGLARLPIP